MAECTYWSDDHRYGVRIDDELISKMLRLSTQAAGDETGGILVGRYTEELNCAVVRGLSQAPSDSTGGHTWFNRGVRGIQRWIDWLWTREHQYYLGEWHLHPGGAPDPSPTDIDQMEQIAGSPNYHCPEPILIIIGGNPPLQWEMKVYVFPLSTHYAELRQARADQSSVKAKTS